MNTPYDVPKTRPLSADQIKERFRQHGESLAAWSRANGYNPHFVYCVLNGQYKGHRGRSHEVAVKLGLKIVPHKQAA